MSGYHTYTITGNNTYNFAIISSQTNVSTLRPYTLDVNVNTVNRGVWQYNANTEINGVNLNYLFKSGVLSSDYWGTSNVVLYSIDIEQELFDGTINEFCILII